MIKKSVIISFILTIFITTVIAATFIDNSESDFNLGNYYNTEYNESSVILMKGNLSGSYISRIFNTSNISRWNDIYWQKNTPETGHIAAVDGQGKVYASQDSGITWILKNNSYGRTSDTQDMFSDSLNNIYIITNSNREVWKSTNNGITWIKINDTFSNKDLFVGTADYEDNLYIIAGQSLGVVYKSTDEGITWNQVNNSYNEGNGAAKGITNILFRTNLSLQARNCSLSDCSDKIFVGPDGTANTFFTNLTNNLNLISQYFQYKINFSTQDSSITPLVYNITINYEFSDTTSTSSTSSTTQLTTTTTQETTTTSSTTSTTVENTLIRISLISPLDNSTWDSSNDILFKYNVTSVNNITLCSLIINNTIDQENTDISKDIIQTFTKTLPNLNYLWYVNCSNNINLTESSETFTLLVNFIQSNPATPNNVGGGGGGGNKITNPQITPTETQTQEEIPVLNPPINTPSPKKIEETNNKKDNLIEDNEQTSKKESFSDKIKNLFSLTGNLVSEKTNQAQKGIFAFVLMILLLIFGLYLKPKKKKREIIFCVLG